MKNILNKILGAFSKNPEPTYGWGIFHQRTWLSRQVDEAMRKRAYDLD